MTTLYVIRFATGELCEEGPWNTAEEAQRFLDAEVGKPAKVEALEEIKQGQRVRSFDFEHRDDCYVEGYVVGFDLVEGCPRYVIQASVDVWEGEQLDPAEKGCRVGRVFYPPVNGTPRSMGGFCHGVRAV